MGCVSLYFVENLLIWLIVICAVLAIVKLLIVPYVLTPMGQPGVILIQVVNIIVWAVIAVAIVVIIFDLLSCALGGGMGLGLPRSRL
jgi:hypothetical protein